MERIQRRAAYEIVSGDVSKWSSTVKRNREAEHVTFIKPAIVDSSSAALVSKFEPTTDLENEMHEVLRQAGATEDDVRKFEELELNKLTLEQAQKRQGELARMRVLLMRQEEKARRHAKIKSKAFRRSVRRDKAREAEKQVVAEPGTFEAAVERQKKLEFERAHLRATQKHTKGTKWLQQQMKNHGTSMEGTKEAIADAQRNAERLKNFINDGRQTEGDDSYAEGENDDVGEYGAGDDDAADEPTTGLMAMKFMKRGIERAAEASAEAGERAQRDDYDNPEGSDDGAQHGRRSFGGANGGADDVVAATGDGVLTGSRKIVDGGALVGKAALTAAHKARAHDVMTIDFSDIVGAQSPEAVSSTRAAADVTAQSAPTVNPWLDSTRASTTAAASRRQVATNRERKALDRGRVSDGASIREREARSARAAEEAGGGNELVIDLNNTLLTSSSAASSSATARKRESEADDVRDTARALPGFDLASASDAQQALINRAFATGPDDEEFHGAKKALVEANLPPMPDTVDSQAPGWGSWTGAGVVAKPMSSFKKRKLEMLRAQVEKERADALKKRRDAKLPDVVISEQRDKKVAPVQLSRLPYGYDTEAQLSALTAAPLGADWNSHRQHARLVHAPVTTRPGQLIEPMKPTPAMEKRASEILKKRSLGRSERKKQ